MFNFKKGEEFENTFQYEGEEQECKLMMAPENGNENLAEQKEPITEKKQNENSEGKPQHLSKKSYPKNPSQKDKQGDGEKNGESKTRATTRCTTEGQSKSRPKKTVTMQEEQNKKHYPKDGTKPEERTLTSTSPKKTTGNVPGIKEEPELVSEPEPKKRPDVKFKSPKGPKVAKKPLEAKPGEGYADPKIDAVFPLRMKGKEPLKIKSEGMFADPRVEYNFPFPKKNETPETIPQTCPSVKTKPVGETQKKVVPKRKKNAPGKKKLLWIPPPPVQPEPYEFPPEERRLCDILKEEKISPTKRYAKKPRKMDVLIPCKIPWEFWPCIQTQEGMGAFGHQRNAYTKVDQGSKNLVQGELHSETVIPLISQAKGVSKMGMLPFGAYRRNVSTVIDNHEFDNSKLKLCEGYIPLVNKGSYNWNKNDVTIGNIRNQTMNVKYSEKLNKGVERESHTFISRQFAATSEVAGSNIIGKRRGVVVRDERGKDIAKFNRASEQIVPRLFSTETTNLKSGSDFGSFRPVIFESSGGYNMSYDEEVLCKLVLPYQTTPSLPA